MTDIPEDIRAKAKGVLCDLADEMEASRVTGGPFWSGEKACAVIARALMEERERQGIPFEILEQILHDPENQPSQFGTVPASWVHK